MLKEEEDSLRVRAFFPSSPLSTVYCIEEAMGPPRRMPQRPPDIKKGVLNENEKACWLDFCNINKEMPNVDAICPELINKGKRRIRCDDPLVSVFATHAVVSFNKLIKKYVKKGHIYDNLHHHEVIDCKYQKFHDSYCFYMTIEAIEEGILGVYKAVLACYTKDGRTSLFNFILTDIKPTGKMAMGLRHLNSLRINYDTMKGLKKETTIHLEKTHKAMEGKNKGKVETDQYIRLKEQYEALKGICNILLLEIRSQTPKGLNRRSRNPDRWSFPRYSTSGVKMRSRLRTCKGYDYYTLSQVAYY